MNLQTLLSPLVQRYIEEHRDGNVQSLSLKSSPFPEMPMSLLVEQIKGYQTVKKKIPFLCKSGILFPPGLNLEQSSSQATAVYKSERLSGGTLLDLTCGFGIDAFFLSKNFREVTLVEQNEKLLDLVRHNWQVLDRKAEFRSESLEYFLDKNRKKYDCIYLDPARRDSHKNKVFLLEDLSPNIIELQHHLKKIAPKVVTKLSPLIDLRYLLSVLESVEMIEVIAVKNEVKEVLVYQNFEHQTENPIGRAVNLETDEPIFEWEFIHHLTPELSYAEPQYYLYIPNNAILKSGAFAELADKFHLKKLHPNSHLFTAYEMYKGFPGRILKVQPIEAKMLKKGQLYNIISKNYPLKPQDIKKKYKLKDGGDIYLVFTQTQTKKVILKGEKC